MARKSIDDAFVEHRKVHVLFLEMLENYQLDLQKGREREIQKAHEKEQKWEEKKKTKQQQQQQQKNGDETSVAVVGAGGGAVDSSWDHEDDHVELTVLSKEIGCTSSTAPERIVKDSFVKSVGSGGVVSGSGAMSAGESRRSGALSAGDITGTGASNDTLSSATSWSVKSSIGDVSSAISLNYITTGSSAALSGSGISTGIGSNAASRSATIPSSTIASATFSSASISTGIAPGAISSASSSTATASCTSNVIPYVVNKLSRFDEVWKLEESLATAEKKLQKAQEKLEKLMKSSLRGTDGAAILQHPHNSDDTNDAHQANKSRKAAHELRVLQDQVSKASQQVADARVKLQKEKMKVVKK